MQTEIEAFIVWNALTSFISLDLIFYPWFFTLAHTLLLIHHLSSTSKVFLRSVNTSPDWPRPLSLLTWFLLPLLLSPHTKVLNPTWNRPQIPTAL
jgi:hypothetical protein